MTKRSMLWGGALVAGVAVALGPSLLTGPGTDLSKNLVLGWTALPILFLAGVLTSLTPCVYPLIPITVAIFGAGKRARSRGRAAVLSATYVLGIAAMYSSLGLAAAASGRAFGAFMGNPWVVTLFALMMLVFAAAMFGAFELQLPASVQLRLSGVAGVGFGSAFLMGLVAGIVAAPCTGPVLGAVLTFVAQSRDLWMGFWLLLVYALGMGLLFFVLGTFSMSLPKSGAWMDGVKTIFGIALVTVAISFVRPLLPAAPEVALRASTLAWLTGAVVAAAVLAGAIHRTFHGTVAELALKGAGVAVVIGALALRLGWVVEPARGGEAPVAAGLGPAAGATPVPARIEWLHSEAEALAKAKATGKPVLADFFAEWCTACKELDKLTFTDPRVRERVARDFVPLKVDGTDDTDEVRALQAKYGVVGLPLVTVIGPDGRQQPDPKVAGFLPPEQFLVELAKVPRPR